MTLYKDVGLFHEKFNLPRARVDGGRQAPALPRQEVFAYRMRFMQEELEEFVLAQMNDDLPGMADALADLVWVALGTAHYLGLPFDQVWVEVRRANMEKVLRSAETPGDHKRGSIEVIRKPVGWEPPDIDRVLDQEASHFGKGDEAI